MSVRQNKICPPSIFLPPTSKESNKTTLDYCTCIIAISMPKKKAGSKRRRDETWTGLDHAIRSASKLQKSSSYQDRRKEALSRNSLESQKLQLHIVKTQREIETLRTKLKAWDDVEEAKRIQKQEETEPPTKQGKKGPETWKLRGAARPAWEVYDFDTRYEDKHAKAHEEACEKAKRSRNILVLYKGRMGQELGPPQPASRNFLALLMQLGHLCLQAKKYKAARAAFIECMDLDGTDAPITSARCQLMRLYLEANRPESARRLWERLEHDSSVWIRYSAALVEYVSWKLLKEKGSTRESADALLARAIQANVFCAYYLAFSETFDTVMEYTEDIEDANEETLEEAIEYCCSEQRGAWMETEGSIEWLKQVILQAMKGGTVAGGKLTKADLEWEERLEQLVQQQQQEENSNDEMEAESEDDDEEHDTKMFAGMFRTGMEMLQGTGEFANALLDSTINEENDGKEKKAQSESDGESIEA